MAEAIRKPYTYGRWFTSSSDHPNHGRVTLQENFQFDKYIAMEVKTSHQEAINFCQKFQVPRFDHAGQTIEETV